MFQAQALHAQEEVPDEFSSSAVDAPAAYELVKACMPSIGESAFNQSIRQAGDTLTVTTYPEDKTKPFVTVVKGRVYCVKRSAQGNPVMPLAAFDETINFPEMPKDEIRKFRTDLSRQLAAVGSASALVINDSGNAYQVAFLFNSDRPSKLYYRAGFLKKGEFDANKFPSVYRTTGTMSVTSRGQQSEYYKPFYR
jgi:hypothetical protein